MVDERLVRETAALELAMAKRAPPPEDPVAFARLAGLGPEGWQERVLRSTRDLLLNASRQAGKSTTTSVLALHRAMTRPKQLVLLLSPSLRQSGELFRKVLAVANALPFRPPMTEESRLSLQLGNGSRIVSLPSSEGTIRGFSAVSLLVVDEAAFVADDLVQAVVPMLAVSRGQMIMLSTPNGRRGYFYNAWTRGGDEWERVEVSCWNVPYISKDFLERERKVKGALFAQEFECQFVHASTGRVFDGFDESVNCIERLP